MSEETSYGFSGPLLIFMFPGGLYPFSENGGHVKKIKVLAVSLLLSGCVPGDCINNCYIWGRKDLELLHKCNMDPLRADCPVQR
jgi:hypothetical protein